MFHYMRRTRHFFFLPLFHRVFYQFVLLKLRTEYVVMVLDKMPSTDTTSTCIYNLKTFLFEYLSGSDRILRSGYEKNPNGTDFLQHNVLYNI